MIVCVSKNTVQRTHQLAAVTGIARVQPRGGEAVHGPEAVITQTRGVGGPHGIGGARTSTIHVDE